MFIRDQGPETGASVDDPTLAMHVVSLDDEVLVVVEGVVDPLTIDRFRDTLGRAVTNRMVLDLAGVTFFDAATVSALLVVCAEVHARGGTFAIRSISPLGRRVLQLVGLETHLGLIDDGSSATGSAISPSSMRVDARPVRGKWAGSDLRRPDASS